MTYFSKGIAKTRLKREHKALLLESIRAGRCAPSHGMTRDEAITMLSQDIADYDEILARFGSDRANAASVHREVSPLKRSTIGSGENWHEERDRLVQLLEGIEAGKITHIDEGDAGELRITTSANISALEKRLALLNARLGNEA